MDRTQLVMAFAVTLIALATAAEAAHVTIEVASIRSDQGQAGCAFFRKPLGFPLEASNAQVAYLPAKQTGVTCLFQGLEVGTYAVSVVYYLASNTRADTKILGIPTEDWAVSTNVRPTLRAPRREESASKRRMRQSNSTLRWCHETDFTGSL